MCGICGWFEPHPIGIATATIEAMLRTIYHRGPDGAGVESFVNGAVANTRLGIIDLDTGDQPIPNEDRSRWVVFNGEIYNFRELRRDLEIRGHRFCTRSDTEVIVHAYEQWGPECVRRLDGMFAFCVVESAGGSVRRAFLARDPLGKKPLFWARTPSGGLAFGSEIKALLAHPAIRPAVEMRALAPYLTYGYVPAPLTMFAGVQELPPAHTLSYERRTVTARGYQSGDPVPALRKSVADVAAHVADGLRAAVRARLVSDVPLGAFLSGGLDSTAVVALMASLSDTPVQTFSVGFEEDTGYSELDHARIAARWLRTEHHEFVVRPDAATLVERLVWHYDQPFADSSAIPTYLLAKAAREHVKVVLTGDGGDEAFAGYERFTAARLAETYARVPRPVRAMVERFVRTLPVGAGYHDLVTYAERFLGAAALPPLERYLSWVSVFDPDAVNALCTVDGMSDAMRHFQEPFEQAPAQDLVARLLHVNLKTYLPGDLLVKTDRMTMAHSLEARSPFLDRRLLALAAAIPSGLKTRGLQSKWILRRVLRGVVPPSTLGRRKHGFGVPVGRWFRTTLRDYVQDHITSHRALARGYFHPAAVRRLVDEHLAGVRDHGHRLWALLTLEVWHSTFIDRWSPHNEDS